jgi:prophage regulatory protein
MNAIPAGLYLSVEQVASRYNVSKDTIWRWRREGDFPKPIRLGGKTSRWRLIDIEAWEGTCSFGFIACLPNVASA